MKVRIRCKRASARRYQKNCIRLMYALRQPRMPLAHLDTSDLPAAVAALDTMYTPYVQPRTVMQGGQYTLNKE